jgi:uncharacterized protein with HEPN domain
MDKRDIIILEKILKETVIITDLISGYDCELFISEEKTKRAVCMTLINIGELVKLLSDSVKGANSVIPWRSISGLRDVTAHGYQTLRMEDIWETITTDVPVLQRQIKEIRE